MTVSLIVRALTPAVYDVHDRCHRVLRYSRIGRIAITEANSGRKNLLKGWSIRARKTRLNPLDSSRFN